MSDSPRAYARLSHDVGKYVSRIARNIGDGPIPEALVGLLVKDLYELPGGSPASAVFAEMSADLPDAEELRAAREGLSRIDALEARVRNGEEAAMREAAAHALSVAESLRALAARMGEERA